MIFKGTVTGYYKDVTNLMDWRKYVGRSIQNIELNVFTNADYGNIKGLEFTFTKRTGRFVGERPPELHLFHAKAEARITWGRALDRLPLQKRITSWISIKHILMNAQLHCRSPRVLVLASEFQTVSNWTTNFQFRYGSGLP